MKTCFHQRPSFTSLSLGTVTGYGTGGWSLISDRGKILLFSPNSDRLCGAPSLLSNGYHRTLSPGGNVAGG
jgi:hypothetical protein